MSESLKVVAWECRAKPEGWSFNPPKEHVAAMAAAVRIDSEYWEPYKQLVYKEDAERQLRNARRVVEQLESKQKRNREELAKAARELKRLRAEAGGFRVPLQGGMDNGELLAAWRKKVPGVEPSETDLRAFALGVEVGSARDAWRRVVNERDALRAEVERLRAPSTTCPACGSDANERDELTKAEREIERLRAKVERLRSACSRENDTISQTLGRALDYPRFADDQKNFPGATDADGVCVGDHVAASLADEAADAIRALRAEVERLRAEVETLKAFERAACDLLPGVYYMDPPDGGDVSIIEQLRRMSEDAAKARAMQRLTDINQSLGLYDAAPQPPAKEGKT